MKNLMIGLVSVLAVAAVTAYGEMDRVVLTFDDLSSASTVTRKATDIQYLGKVCQVELFCTPGSNAITAAVSASNALEVVTFYSVTATSNTVNKALPRQYVTDAAGAATNQTTIMAPYYLSAHNLQLVATGAKTNKTVVTAVITIER